KEFGGEFRALCQHRTKAGEIIYCEWYNTVLVDADGRRSSVVARALDVTARKRSDDALRKLNVGLEARVLERTRAMSAAMQDLYEEMAERQRLEQQILKVSEHEQGSERSPEPIVPGWIRLPSSRDVQHEPAGRDSEARGIEPVHR
ncbi:MAG: hypothetical protein V4710_18635, partial [Verrucomicrobiota bacterium]